MSSRWSSARNRTCSSTARAASRRGSPAMRRNRSLIAKTCPSVRGGGGDRGGRLAFHAPSWRIRSLSPSVTTARMSLVRDIVRLYDVARLAAGPPGVPPETRRNRFATRFEAFSAFDYRAPVTPRELPQVRVRKPWWHPAHRRHLGIGPIRLHELEQPCPRARTWSLHHRAWLCFRLLSCEGFPPSRSPAEGSKHGHAGKILRDHRGP